MRTITLRAAALVALIGAPAISNASIIVTATEAGGDVVFSGGGSADVTALLSEGTSGNVAALIPSDAVYLSSVDSSGTTDLYRGITGPVSFGSGGYSIASSFGGDTLGITYRGTGASYRQLIALPTGYVSNTALSTTTTFSGETFATLGLDVGTYVWTWATGNGTDSFTLQIGGASPAPEPATSALLSLGLLGAGLRRWRTAR